MAQQDCASRITSRFDETMSRTIDRTACRPSSSSIVVVACGSAADWAAASSAAARAGSARLGDGKRLGRHRTLQSLVNALANELLKCASRDKSELVLNRWRESAAAQAVGLKQPDKILRGSDRPLSELRLNCPCVPEVVRRGEDRLKIESNLGKFLQLVDIPVLTVAKDRAVDLLAFFVPTSAINSGVTSSGFKTSYPIS